MADRISSLDLGYITGDLSIYPEALDDRSILFEVANNAITTLKQSVTFNSKKIVVEDTSIFPDNGLIRIGPPFGQYGNFELIYYNKKTKLTFEDLARGYGGSRRSAFAAGSSVAAGVFAEHHNAVKDALIKMEVNLGLKEFPSALSLNGILKAQETRFLAPRPLFRAFPIKGPPQLKVRFQNFSTGPIIRNLWDFGDGGTSLEQSPTHTYLQEGFYTVKLNIITSLGAQGVVTKTNYITVDSDETIPFIYVADTPERWSIETATARTAGTHPSVSPIVTPTDATMFSFVDQTDGDIIQRNWNFGDGDLFIEQDPDIHIKEHDYLHPGEYNVTLFAVFSNGKFKIATLPTPLIVL